MNKNTTVGGIPKEDWAKLEELCAEFAEALINNNLEKIESFNKLLMMQLDRLEKKYGSTPATLATRADFVESKKEKRRLLEKAYQLAKATEDLNNCVIIAASIVSFYLDDLPDQTKAQSWLKILREEMRLSPEILSELEYAMLLKQFLTLYSK